MVRALAGDSTMTRYLGIRRNIAPAPRSLVKRHPASNGVRHHSTRGRRSGDGDEDGVALATAAAEGSGAENATAALQLVEQRQRDAGARHADGVAQRDGATVDVGDPVGDAEVRHRGQAAGGDRPVESDTQDVGDLLYGALEDAVVGPGRMAE